MQWKKLCTSLELDLFKTLYSGQTFRWIYDQGIHKCVLFHPERKSHHLILLYQQSSCIQYYAIPPVPDSFLHWYFSLDLDMPKLYEEWSKDSYFASVSKEFQGLRMVRGDIVEVLMSFLCSQNNHLRRITSMVHALATQYGTPIQKYMDLDTLPKEESVALHDHPWLGLSPRQILERCGDLCTFPEWEDLQGDVDTTLRNMGFGYRAKYFVQTRDLLSNQHPSTREYLTHLATLPLVEARAELLALAGVGRKVADCVLLFGLQQFQVVPADTHVLRIVQDHYPSFLHKRGVSKKQKKDPFHDIIQRGFEQTFGTYAGIAHSVLFFDSLKNTHVNAGTEWVRWKEE
jgi:N-glycosylase/DNA lyase